ncbi:MAG: hypothetical protein FJ087_12425 [Deltaproteobacteria bacterium]|nr:hypothetical protein [Deltaproteobacteria bacterium]
MTGIPIAAIVVGIAIIVTLAVLTIVTWPRPDKPPTGGDGEATKPPRGAVTLGEALRRGGWAALTSGMGWLVALAAVPGGLLFVDDFQRRFEAEAPRRALMEEVHRYDGSGPSGLKEAFQAADLVDLAAAERKQRVGSTREGGDLEFLESAPLRKIPQTCPTTGGRAQGSRPEGRPRNEAADTGRDAGEAEGPRRKS